ncbi:succinyldiaminopimelate transaminase [Spelaeicoccus albus]|uniref:Succinyldiaminopimelate transaminase n=1 Tax=Spelaeicoccus albus TaxID=1280376 RepID=A0A7Z0D3A0_9MICO|nr:succinyldiaminopimelate transaminase [Spelaeicoccus albus]NYI68072.1 succinyldiaminopimelate transaminase [Spelaeicoccus albus]
MSLGLTLPDYPWESLAPYAKTARSHPGGVVDVSIGTPVDDTPPVVRQALADAANAPGYPSTAGSPALRRAITDWFARRRGVPDLDPDTEVVPTIGSKEAVAWLPTMLGLTPDDVVAHPLIAYPTYDMGARIAGCGAVPVDQFALLTARSRDTDDFGRVRMMWVNSPSNPTGAVLDVDTLRALVQWARANDVLLVSDECYAEMGWDVPSVPSLLDPRVTGGDHENLLVAYSLSKQSSAAGYRASFLAGDAALIGNLTTTRKHAGMIVPWPVQEATRAALGDDEHVAAQRARYSARRSVLKPALTEWGLRIDQSVAGLYLWGTAGEDCWTTIGRLADLGILAGPGIFYGDAGREYVRVSLTASDERIDAAAERLAAP